MDSAKYAAKDAKKRMDEENAKKSNRRAWPKSWWPLVVALLLLAGAYGFTEWSDSSFRYPAALALTLVTTIVVAFWLVLSSPLRRATKAAVLATGALLFLGLVSSIRTDGWSGDMVPRFAWRWTPRPDELLEPPADIDAEGNADLESTTPYDSPQFLGADRNGVISNVRLASDWKSNPPRELWRRSIGAGWGSFAIVGDFAVTQEQRGSDEATICYRLSTGEPVWSHVNPEVRFSEEMGGVGPRATPTISDGKAYVLGATGILDCLNGSDGSVVWSRNIVEENNAKVPDWAKSCSPLVLDERVIVSAGGPDGKSLVAYDRSNGELAWAAGDAPSSYGSPTIVTLAGRKQIVIVNAQSVAGHDAENGTVLWTYDFPGQFPKATQPIPIDDQRLLVAAGYGLGARMLQSVTGSDGQLSVQEEWQSRDLKPKFTNLIVRDGFVYGLDEGIFTCIDLQDGKRRWKKGRYGHGQILLVGDLLLIQGEKGEVVLVEPTPEELREVASFPALSSKTWNNPTVAGKYLLVRNDVEAACFELPLRN